MGCHTWFYKKVEVSYEQAKKSLIKVYNDEIELLGRWIANPKEADYLEMFEYYPEFTIEEMSHWVEIYKRKLRRVEGGYCKQAVMNHYSEGLDSVIHYVKGRGHYRDIDTHDIFRIGNYPEDELFSMEDTLSFIERMGDRIYYRHDDWKKLLQDFWSENPDGMISFG